MAGGGGGGSPVNCQVLKRCAFGFVCATFLHSLWSFGFPQKGGGGGIKQILSRGGEMFIYFVLG